MAVVVQPLATPDDLRRFLDLRADELDDARARLLIDGVSAQVRAYCGHGFIPVVDETIVLDGSGTAVLLTPAAPVRAVTEIVENPDGSATVLAAGDDFEWSATGVLRRLGGGVWTRRARWYRVAYRYGHDDVPADVRDVVLRVAGRAVGNPAALTTESMGGYATGYGFDTSRFAVLADPDRRVLDPYRVGHP